MKGGQQECNISGGEQLANPNKKQFQGRFKRARERYLVHCTIPAGVTPERVDVHGENSTGTPQRGNTFQPMVASRLVIMPPLDDRHLATYFVPVAWMRTLRESSNPFPPATGGALRLGVPRRPWRRALEGQSSIRIQLGRRGVLGLRMKARRRDEVSLQVAPTLPFRVTRAASGR